MSQPRQVKRVDVYRRHKGVPGDRFRFLLTEKPVAGEDVHGAAREMVAELSREFPDYEFVLVVRLACPRGEEEDH